MGRDGPTYVHCRPHCATTPMIDTVRLALGRPARQQTHVECRNCGTGLAKGDAQCPACGSGEVARYEL